MRDVNALPALAALAVLSVGTLLTQGCAPSGQRLLELPQAWQQAAAPARPEGCVDVAAGAALQPLLQSAVPGIAFCLAPGVYAAPIHIPSGVTVWGTRDAVLRSSGTGTTVRLSGQGAALLGLTVDGSGTRYDLEEGAVALEGRELRVEGVRIHSALFGIAVAKSEHIVLRGNVVEGTDQVQLGMRGDAIRLWETRFSRVEDNLVIHSRDLVVWYSSDNVLTGNEVRDSRYGTHLMYSHRNLLERNRYLGNVVGVFLMYSRDVRLLHNLLAGSAGAAGMGLGVKESSAVVAEGNAFVKDAVGVYLDNSPFEPGTTNEFQGNALRLCDVGVLLQSGVHGNRFLGNSLRGNGTQVRVEGAGNGLANLFQGNDWDDYQGYDVDGDGRGDVPYELRNLSDHLAAEHPEIDLLRGSPALFLVNAASRLMPLYASPALVVDASPALSNEASNAH
jgi:nitrous oxidase accessory protein